MKHQKYSSELRSPSIGIYYYYDYDHYSFSREKAENVVLLFAYLFYPRRRLSIFSNTSLL